MPFARATREPYELVGRSLMTVCPICHINASDTTRSRCPIGADWCNEERMAFLTSLPPPDDSNAREQMVDFWSTAIAHAYEHATKLSLDAVKMAKSTLAWEGTVAPGLAMAMRSLVASGKLVPEAEFKRDKGIARRLVETPLVYLMGMLSVRGHEVSVPEGRYIHRDVLEGIGSRVLRQCQDLPDDERTLTLSSSTDQGQQQDPTDLLGDLAPWSLSQVCRVAADSGDKQEGLTRLMVMLSSEDVEVLARYLVRTRRAVRDGELLKLAGGGAGGSWVSRGVSDTDRDLLRLRCTVASLQFRTRELERRVKERRRDAVEASREGNKRAALLHMKRMKDYQAWRDNRLTSLYTLEKALHQVQRMRVDMQVLQAHEAATKALKSYREAHGLSVERVEDTIDALSEEMGEHEAIGDALGREGAITQDSEENAELEMELDRLLEEEAAEVGGAVSIPSQVPSMSRVAASPSTIGPRHLYTPHGGDATRHPSAAVIDSSSKEQPKVLVPLPS